MQKAIFRRVEDILIAGVIALGTFAGTAVSSSLVASAATTESARPMTPKYVLKGEKVAITGRNIKEPVTSNRRVFLVLDPEGDKTIHIYARNTGTAYLKDDTRKIVQVFVKNPDIADKSITVKVGSSAPIRFKDATKLGVKKDKEGNCFTIRNNKVVGQKVGTGKLKVTFTDSFSNIKTVEIPVTVKPKYNKNKTYRSTSDSNLATATVHGNMVSVEAENMKGEPFNSTLHITITTTDDETLYDVDADYDPDNDGYYFDSFDLANSEVKGVSLSWS